MDTFELRAVAFFALSATLVLPASAADEVFQNDDWSSGEVAAFQGGFVEGEIGASTFVPEANDYPVVVRRIELLFGGSQEGVEQQVDLMIWQDDGRLAPGALLLDERFVMVASTRSLTSVDLSLHDVRIESGGLRVGLRFRHSGFPSIARDVGDNDFPSRNLIFTPDFGWVRSMDFGVLGDWIIRLVANTRTSSTVFRRADLNQDGGVDIADALRLIFYLFVPGTPLDCLDAGDFNNDASLGAADAIAILSWLFQSGPEPAEPGPWTCGLDPDERALGCLRFGGCET